MCEKPEVRWPIGTDPTWLAPSGKIIIYHFDHYYVLRTDSGLAAVASFGRACGKRITSAMMEHAELSGKGRFAAPHMERLLSRDSNRNKIPFAVSFDVFEGSTSVH